MRKSEAKRIQRTERHRKKSKSKRIKSEINCSLCVRRRSVMAVRPVPFIWQFSPLNALQIIFIFIKNCGLLLELTQSHTHRAIAWKVRRSDCINIRRTRTKARQSLWSIMMFSVSWRYLGHFFRLPRSKSLTGGRANWRKNCDEIRRKRKKSHYPGCLNALEVFKIELCLRESGGMGKLVWWRMFPFDERRTCFFHFFFLL